MCASSKLPRLAIPFVAIVLGLGLPSSCAILKAASYSQQVFLREEDPQLAADALPSFIKVSEMLLAADPDNRDKIVATASLYVLYASAFIEGPASLLPDEQYQAHEEAVRRAGALYRRAFRLLSPALERRSPGFLAAVGGPKEAAAAARFGVGDVPLLYWSAASILAAYGLNPLDFVSAGRLGAVPALLSRAAALEPGWDNGAVYALYFPYYASLPDYLGGSRAKAEEAYAKALTYSKGLSASLFVSRATSICIPDDDYDGYTAALEKALAVNLDADPDSRLANVIAQDRARRLLADADKYFSITKGE
ncbi:MAG: TRAP transporter TatT component family protein [Rectinemataceae bacterium]